MKIDVSKYCDGQGAFKNGMHDRKFKFRLTDNLYRKGFDKDSTKNRILWQLGWLFQSITSLGHVHFPKAPK